MTWATRPDLEQKEAQNRAACGKSERLTLRQAEADLAKAEDGNCRSGPVLAERVRTLKVEVSGPDCHQAYGEPQRNPPSPDAAALRILELQRDRQKVSLGPFSSQSGTKLELEGQSSGMVAIRTCTGQNYHGSTRRR